MANIISTLFKFGEDGSGLSKIRADVAQTDGAINKFKVGAGGAFDFVKQNAAGLAASGGAAIVAFGAQAIKTYTDTAIEAKNLSALTGDNIEQSSRLNAVWKQTGADGKDLQDVLLQMGDVLSSNSALAKQLGIDLTDGATGGERFQQVARALDEIPDAAERSRIAAQLFGEEGVRQYTALRTAVGDVSDAMAGVSDAQVIDEEEARKAEELARKMRELNASFQGFVVAAGEAAVTGAGALRTIGSGLGEVLSPWNREARETNDAVVKAFEASEEAARNFDRAQLDGLKTSREVRLKVIELTGDYAAANTIAVEWAENERKLQEQLKQTTTAQDMIAESINAAKENVDRFGVDGVENMGAVEDAADDTAEAVDGITESFEDLRDEINNRKAYRDLGRQFEDVKASAVDAYGAAATGAEDAAEKAEQYKDDVDDLRLAVLDYAEQIGGIPPAKMTQIQALIDQGKYDEAMRLLAELERERVIKVRVETGQINPKLTLRPNEKAADGSYWASGATEINDGNGPEILTLPTGTKVDTAENSENYRRMRGSSEAPVVHVTVQGAFLGTKADVGRWVIDGLRAAQRQGASLTFLGSGN